MPRPKAPGAPEPKRRSRTGCWNCKSRKVKCDEQRPRCMNCERNGERVCDYSIRLNWGGRAKRKGTSTPEPSSPGRTPSGSIPGASTLSFGPDSPTVGSSTQSESAMTPTQLVGTPTSFSPQASTQRFSSFMLDPPARNPAIINLAPSSFPFQTSSPVQLSPPPFPEPKAPAAAPNVETKSFAPSSAHPAKRQRHDSSSDHGYAFSMQSPPARPQSFGLSQYQPNTYPTSYASSPLPPVLAGDQLLRKGQPLTPSASSMASEDPAPTPAPTSAAPTADDDPRRLSVNSLLIQEEADAKSRPFSSRQDSDDRTKFYGIDRGLPDLDVPRNDDKHVLDVITPVLASAEFGKLETDGANEFGFGLSSSKVSDYTENLHVKIAKTLLPLPAMLLDNPMNLMYFHFFIEYTARILVPHDCPANPFKIILPQMAVRDDNLLHLLLAYSASHRARLLGHREPSNRIAFWVSDVFPNLRRALDDPTREISSANVATAIMLASLEIIAPGTFGIEIPWQDHLSIARRMIASRGGSRSIDVNRDRVSHFLIRWFAYLDILGNFSTTGVSKEPIMFSGDLYEFNNENDFTIDCILGFSGFLSGLLARIADLARRCDEDRLTSEGEIDSTWRPSHDIAKAAENMKSDLAIARKQKYTLCPHRHSSSPSECEWETTEMAATNEAFHWAGLVHLYRRVLGLPQHSSEVQSAVREIVRTIYRVRKGGSAEACLIFPLFTAGCQAQESAQRDVILDRIKSIESSGMTQVQKARKLLESVWKTGRPWETLVHGEFFG